jgi:U3 small nucleolar RNA-associated protein 21
MQTLPPHCTATLHTSRAALLSLADTQHVPALSSTFFQHLQAARLVRQFRGHTAAVSDMRVSEDCRWLLSASLDGTVRCWDIPGGWHWRCMAR